MFPKRVDARRVNPSRRAELGTNELRDAGHLLSEFSGHEPEEILKIKQTPMKTGLVIGEMDGVLYTTVRDGKTEKYIHRFKKQSRPLLTASSDGTQLGIVGGQYQFTEAGIEDR